jgi:CrcB protein
LSALGWLAFLSAAALGACARHLLGEHVRERVPGRFPWGTFVINASGSLLLGVITGLGIYHGLAKVPALVLGVGFCGAYTTFSTFAVETVRLLEDGAVKEALHHSLGGLLTCVTAAAAGLALAAL